MSDNDTTEWLTNVYEREWLTNVYERVLCMAESSEGFDFSKQDYEDLAKRVEDLYKRGYTKDDAVRYLFVTEELNPDMDEDVALLRMKRISDKYTASDRRELQTKS
jgi:hypothetical protein